MNRLVRIQYGKDSKSRTERGLRLGEHPKYIMNAPAGGGVRGNSVMTSRPARAGRMQAENEFIRSFVRFLYVIGANTRTECIK